MTHSIKYRFGFTLAAIIVVGIFSISLPLILLNARSMDGELRGQMSQLADFSEETLPVALWQYNYEYAKDFIASLFLYEDVAFASLTVNGKEIVKKVRPEFQNYSFSRFRSSGSFVSAETPISYKNQYVGEIYLVLSRDRIKKEIWNNLMLSILVVVLLAAGVVTTNIKMSNWYIFKPLFNLEKSVKEISQGNLDTKIRIDQEDEIGQLAKSFETMITNLKKITASRDELNYEISQRIKTEQKYRNLYENAQIGMFQSRVVDGKMIESNSRMAQIFGYESPEECISKYVAKEHYVDPSQRVAVVKLLKEKGEIINFQTQIRLDNGTIKWIQFSGTISECGDLFDGVAADITEQKNAEQKVRASLDEKEVLLKEIHHRVKNNLQMIQSLLSLQLNEIEDKKQKKALIDSNSRIKSMSLIHETLTQSEDVGKLDIRQYISDIISYLKKIYTQPEKNIDFSILVDEIEMNLDQCISCGLIINELVSNSMKYAFSSRTGGRISLILKAQNPDLAELTVSDDGRGFETMKNIETYKSLGLRIVNVLVKGQLKGTIRIKNENGVSFIINFPINRPINRIG